MTKDSKGSSVFRGSIPPAAQTAAPAGHLKASTAAKLRPENDPAFKLRPEDPAFQRMMAGGVGKDDALTPEDRAYQQYQRFMILMGEILEESIPSSFKTAYETPHHIGEQRFDTREDVARGVDRLASIADIARMGGSERRLAELDFSGLPLSQFSGQTPNGQWSSIKIPSVKVDKDFQLNGSFQQAFQIVLASEGGFSNHRADRGGATIYGIASRSNPDAYARIMDHLKRGDQAGAMQVTMDTYKTRYWDTVRGIENLTPSARLVAFDAAVNHGVGFANRMIAATQGDADAMIEYRSRQYAAIIRNDASQAVFEKGWGNRLAKLDALTDTSERNAGGGVTLAAASRVERGDSRDSPKPQPA